MVRSRFQRYKVNLEGTVGRRESQIPEKEREKKLEAEQPAVQKNESTNTVIVSVNKNKHLAFKNTVPGCMFCSIKLNYNI